MSNGFYIDRDSALHRLHPVTKIILLGLSFASALILDHPLWLLGLAIFYGLAGAQSGVFRGLRRVFRLLILIALASFLIWSFAFAGQTVLAAPGPFVLTREGMIFGAGMGLRLDLMVFCGLIFLAATPVEDLTNGLTKMKVPFAMSFALSLSFRLAPLFLDTVRTIQSSQRARGLDTGAGGPLRRMKGYVPLLVPVFAGALRRTDQLATALESKGFGRGRARGRFREYAVGAADALALLAMVLIIAGEAVARYYGLGLVRPG